MMKTRNPISPGLIEIHAAVLLFGLAGLFGKWLSLPPWYIVMGRTGFATIVLFIVLIVLREKPPKDLKTVGVFSLLGLLLAIHWIAFFKSIQVSTVAVGLLAFSTFPVFITFLEPWWFNEERRKVDLITASMVVAGLGVIVYPSSLGGHLFSGALWGTFAGFSFAILSLLNRQWVQSCAPVVIAFFQNLFAFTFLLPMVVWSTISIEIEEVGLLLILGVFCTALSHFLFIRSLKTIRAQLASIITGLEPVYGILFAYVFLKETPSVYTLVGGFLILSATLVATVSSRNR